LVATQQELDAVLNRQHVFNVDLSPDAPLPHNRPIYDPVRQLTQTGFRLTLRELLHAIGSKTAALPSNRQDDCIRASLLYTYILDLEADNLCFLPYADSDLVTPRSQEVGIGMVCLLANRLFDVPWDQLGSLPGQGLRFDYRGRRDKFDGIFESKGTRHRGNQKGQIANGLEKKEAHHARGDHFDVELIVSTFIGTVGTIPRILIGDPNFDEFARLYDQSDDRFFRLRHYARILQFVGLPQSAFLLNTYAKKYLKGEMVIADTILDEKDTTSYLEVQELGGQRYFGRWFSTIIPENSTHYDMGRYRRWLAETNEHLRRRRVFQGMREDVYRAGFEGQPFSQDLLSKEEIDRSLTGIRQIASLFPDGTIQLFEQNSHNGIPNRRHVHR
jgi:hypothetical protein